jgi:DNA-binding NarL/FixJ family response regulator
VQALEAFRPDPFKFDLVITRLAMPRMPGLEPERKLTELRPDPPVIICTGLSDAIHEEGARAIGVRGTLSKPQALRDPSEAILEALDPKG